MAAVSFPAVAHWKPTSSYTRALPSAFDGRRSRCTFSTVSSSSYYTLRASNLSSRFVVRCVSTATDLPPVSDTKSSFLKAYRRPIPSIYNNLLQELIVQHHLVKYKRTHKYDPIFALGFVTIYDQLMDGYPSDEDRDAIFEAYIKALKEDPQQYRKDAQTLEEWARTQTPISLVEFPSREREIDGILTDIAARAGAGTFSYSRFFAVGLFRILELANATDPTVLDKLCVALNVNKRSVNTDLDVYRNLLAKLVQAKELLKEYVEREKKKIEERTSQKANEETVKKCVGISVNSVGVLP